MMVIMMMMVLMMMVMIILMMAAAAGQLVIHNGWTIITITIGFSYDVHSDNNGSYMISIGFP